MRGVEAKNHRQSVPFSHKLDRISSPTDSGGTTSLGQSILAVRIPVAAYSHGPKSHGRSSMTLKHLTYHLILALSMALTWPANAVEDKKAEPSMAEEAEQIEHDAGVFGADPTYEEKSYNIDDQLKIYGGKPAHSCH